MSGNVKVCDIEPGLKEKLNEFRYRKEKTNAAIILRVDREKLLVEEDVDLGEELCDFENITIEEVATILPAHHPRYLVYSYVLKHDDGRVSYPLCFVFVSPSGSKPELQMMYAGSKLEVVKELGLSKVFEVRDVEDLTEDWLKAKLSFFR